MFKCKKTVPLFFIDVVLFNLHKSVLITEYLRFLQVTCMYVYALVCTTPHRTLYIYIYIYIIWLYMVIIWQLIGHLWDDIWLDGYGMISDWTVIGRHLIGQLLGDIWLDSYRMTSDWMKTEHLQAKGYTYPNQDDEIHGNGGRDSAVL